MSLTIKNSVSKKNKSGNIFVISAMALMVLMAVFIYFGLPAIRLYGLSTFTPVPVIQNQIDANAKSAN